MTSFLPNCDSMSLVDPSLLATLTGEIEIIPGYQAGCAGYARAGDNFLQIQLMYRKCMLGLRCSQSAGNVVRIDTNPFTRLDLIEGEISASFRHPVLRTRKSKDGKSCLESHYRGRFMIDETSARWNVEWYRTRQGTSNGVIIAYQGAYENSLRIEQVEMSVMNSCTRGVKLPQRAINLARWIGNEGAIAGMLRQEPDVKYSATYVIKEEAGNDIRDIFLRLREIKAFLVECHENITRLREATRITPANFMSVSTTASFIPKRGS